MAGSHDEKFTANYFKARSGIRKQASRLVHLSFIFFHVRQSVQRVASTKEAHFTVLVGFTAANGNPVLCPIVFASIALEEEWVLGLDPFAAWGEEEEYMKGNSGKGKQYPQGPVCVVDEKSSPTYCCVSEIGSITAELLVGMLNHIDNSGLFPRENDPCHF